MCAARKAVVSGDETEETEVGERGAGELRPRSCSSVMRRLLLGRSGSSRLETVEMHAGVAELAIIEAAIAGPGAGTTSARSSKHHERARHQPAAARRCGKRAVAEPLPIGRIGEQQVEGFHRADAAEVGGIAAVDARPPGEAERPRYSCAAGPAPRRSFPRTALSATRATEPRARPRRYRQRDRAPACHPDCRDSCGSGC